MKKLLAVIIILLCINPMLAKAETFQEWEKDCHWAKDIITKLKNNCFERADKVEKQTIKAPSLEEAQKQENVYDHAFAQSLQGLDINGKNLNKFVSKMYANHGVVSGVYETAMDGIISDEDYDKMQVDITTIENWLLKEYPDIDLAKLQKEEMEHRNGNAKLRQFRKRLATDPADKRVLESLQNMIRENSRSARAFRKNNPTIQ